MELSQDLYSRTVLTDVFSMSNGVSKDFVARANPKATSGLDTPLGLLTLLHHSLTVTFTAVVLLYRRAISLYISYQYHIYHV